MDNFESSLPVDKLRFMKSRYGILTACAALLASCSEVSPNTPTTTAEPMSAVSCGQLDANLTESHPSYDPRLDRDADGIACER